MALRDSASFQFIISITSNLQEGKFDEKEEIHLITQKLGRYASPSTRTEALLLDEALASVALLNEVSQPRHVLVDLGIPDKNI